MREFDASFFCSKGKRDSRDENTLFEDEVQEELGLFLLNLSCF